METVELIFNSRSNEREVWQLGKDLGIQEIIDVSPTDGLWEDGRTDLRSTWWFHIRTNGKSNGS